jgi:hypothetical protein
MDVPDTRDMMVRQATGMIMSMVSEHDTELNPLLYALFCCIYVNVLVDHDGFEHAYDANIYMRWLLFSYVNCFL